MQELTLKVTNVATEYCSVVDASVESSEATKDSVLQLDQLDTTTSGGVDQALAAATSACEAEFRASFLEPGVSGAQVGDGAGDTTLLTVQRTQSATFASGRTGGSGADSDSKSNSQAASASSDASDEGMRSRNRNFLPGVQVRAHVSTVTCDSPRAAPVRRGATMDRLVVYNSAAILNFAHC